MDHNTIHIIVTGDIHGRFHASDPVTATPVPGSLARVSGYVDALRRRVGRGNVILADNGDLFTGSPSSFCLNYLLPSSPVPAIISAMGYDLLNSGNHDLEMATLPVAGIPILGANTGHKPHTVITRGGIRIGFTGMLTDSTPHLFNGVEVTSMSDVMPPADADFNIALIHAGTDEIPPVTAQRYDVVVCGHDHRPRITTIGSTPVINPGAGGVNLVHITLSSSGMRCAIVTISDIKPAFPTPSLPSPHVRITDSLHTLIRMAFLSVYPEATQIILPSVNDTPSPSGTDILTLLPYDDHICLASDPTDTQVPTIVTDTHTACCRRLKIHSVSPLPLKSYMLEPY